MGEWTLLKQFIETTVFKFVTLLKAKVFISFLKIKKNWKLVGQKYQKGFAKSIFNQEAN